MHTLWKSWLIFAICIALVPLKTLAQNAKGSGDAPASKPPVGDFDPPKSSQIQIIDDGPVVHDYRSVPQAPIISAVRKNPGYEDLWKSTCETNPDLQFFIQKLSSDNQNHVLPRWLADIGKLDHRQDYRICTDLIFDMSSPARNGKKADLSKSECVIFSRIVMDLKKRLDIAYDQYQSNDEQSSNSARKELTEMAGPAAVARLDETIAEYRKRRKDMPE